MCGAARLSPSRPPAGSGGMPSAARYAIWIAAPEWFSTDTLISGRPVVELAVRTHSTLAEIDGVSLARAGEWGIVRRDASASTATARERETGMNQCSRAWAGRAEIDFDASASLAPSKARSHPKGLNAVN